MTIRLILSVFFLCQPLTFGESLSTREFLFSVGTLVCGWQIKKVSVKTDIFYPNFLCSEKEPNISAEVLTSVSSFKISLSCRRCCRILASAFFFLGGARLMSVVLVSSQHGNYSYL